MNTKETKNKSGLERVLTGIGIALCIILVPILIANCTMIVKSYLHKEEVPSVFSISPMIVLSDSMYPEIAKGDLVIVMKTDTDTLKEGDVISFFDPDPKANEFSVVTHRIREVIENEDQTRSFITNGDNNRDSDNHVVADEYPVPEDKVIGKYKFCIRGAGNVAMFMQTTPGLIVCVALPIALLVAYDLIRRRKYDMAKQADTAALLAELERLRAQSGSSKEPESENQTETGSGESDGPNE